MPLLRGDDPGAIDTAARQLADGQLVALPTETVYGLGARADDDAAVARIFAAKGRPADHPLIVHVADVEAARRFADPFDGDALRLAAAFWPGPVTVIARRRPGAATAAAGGQDTIGLRCPSHPVARDLLARCGELGVWGVAAPSANRFGRISPTRAAHVADEFGPELPVLDGGPCALGIESAIVDVSRGRPVLLRPGSLSDARLAAALGRPLEAPDAGAPRAPGTLASHYAPAATLRLMDAAQLRQALDLLPGGLPGLAVYSRTVAVKAAGLQLRRMPDDPDAAAHELFAVLRELDATGVRLIWVERPPATPEWAGVNDRLSRASAG